MQQALDSLLNFEDIAVKKLQALLKLRIHICDAEAATGVRFRMRWMTCENPYLPRVFSFTAFFVLILEKKSHGAKWI